MDKTFNHILEGLKENGIYLTHQRMKIFEYLYKNRNHPTVEMIYKDLIKEMPTLSKTTVYNTMKILMEAGIVKEIPVNSNESRYDILTEEHGHFKCIKCGYIYDFNLNMESLSVEGLDNFIIYDKDVFFKGICSSCF
ncbi:MAG: transcriptional repressor [Clostridiales bacterium]|nr:transcriptional repressor [Clostridiales bacterium]